MDTWVFAAYLLLTAACIYAIVRLIIVKKWPLAIAVLAHILPFTAYLICAYLLHWNIPWYVLVFTIIAQFVSSYMGYFLNLYERSKIFDRYVHAFSCFTYALLVYCTMTAIFAGTISRLYAAVFIGALGMTIGLLIEIIEFIVDSRRTIETKLQRGLRDTNFDLVSDLIGSLCAAIFSYFILLA